MPVVVKYTVIRKGKEVMAFATKKEADAHDRMLDVAEQLQAFLGAAEFDLSAKQLDQLTYYMAQQRAALVDLLRGRTTGPAEVSNATAQAVTAVEAPKKTSVKRPKTIAA